MNRRGSLLVGKDRMDTLLVALTVWGALQGPVEAPGAPEDLTRLSLDALIERLPPAGAEWIRPAEGNSVWLLVPEAEEFQRRIEGGAVLDAEQWKRALLGSGALRVRSRWPASEPFAVSMRQVGWLDRTEMRLVPRDPGLRAAEVGRTRSSHCGTGAMHESRARLYQELGPLPLGPQRIPCALTLERGQPRGRNVAQLGRFFQGEIELEVEVVPTLDEAIPPCSSPTLDAAVRETLSLAFDVWSGERVALLVADPDPRDARLAGVGLSLALEVLDGERVVETLTLVPSAYDVLAVGSSVHEGSDATIDWAVLSALPAELEHDAARRARWKVRVRGTSEHVLGLWDATSRWSGSLEVSLDELIEREARVAPEGRGPWIYMGTFR